MANLTYCNAGPYGTNSTGAIGPLMQGQGGQTMTLSLLGLDGSAVDVSAGFTGSGTLTRLNSGATVAIDGTLTGGNGSFTWGITTTDTGTSGALSVTFRFTDGSTIYQTLPVRLSVIDNPSVTDTAGAALTSVPILDAAWLAAANAIDATTNNFASWDASDELADSGSAAADFQASDATLTSLAALGTAADKLAYTTGVDTWAETALTAAARTVLDDASTSAMLATLGALALAGGTMAGTLAMADNLLTRPVLKDIAETVQTLGALGGGAVEIDLEAGNVVTGTVDTGSTTITFTNWPAAKEGGCKLYLTNAGSQTLAFTGVLWAGGTAPSWTASGLDVVFITTPDGGTTKVGAAVLDLQAP